MADEPREVSRLIDAGWNSLKIQPRRFREAQALLSACCSDSRKFALIRG